MIPLMNHILILKCAWVFSLDGILKNGSLTLTDQLRFVRSLFSSIFYFEISNWEKRRIASSSKIEEPDVWDIFMSK